MDRKDFWRAVGDFLMALGIMVSGFALYIMFAS